MEDIFDFISKTVFSETEVARLFSLHIKHNHDTITNAAKHYQCTKQYLSAIINCRKPLSPLMLEDIGVERKVIFKKKAN